ncbi:hypothetical protein A1O1_00209 [Capronia coronata CBS 617.96]|uniref:Asp/Glu/hydantoin racemase n=1 Tax=Capronia coronata CBS 617.96 TaxID=1182541 RepID=W9Z0J7_9EURO|nr:uncharacterized protein A1O1_00209 [Capronia coronata CBS 617.96]EXJ95091.1 hypothetical protein A1O1_00209 [Capronia coronata CBS 617.96]
MVRRVRLGVIVPSSNTVLEPLTQAIVASINHPDIEVTVHFSRFRVTKIDLTEDGNSQFTTNAMLAAAQLLADAEVDVIGWSGTSAGWLGFDKDESLCREIHNATGVPATSSIQALNELLRASKAEKMGLVTPYLGSVVDAIRKNYAAIGWEIFPERERHLDLTQNTDFGLVTESQLDSMAADVAKQGADVVAIYCTNLRGARRAAEWEKSHGVVVLDSVATTVWGMLKMVDVPPSAVVGWGSIFSM